MEASLTCAVCLSLFEEPVTLPLCSHNFCRGCLLECLASTEAARLQQQQRAQGRPLLSRAGPVAGEGEPEARVPCPLCRKLCPLPRGGPAALPVNTTLAEVVKLYRFGAAGEAEQEPGLPSPPAPGEPCPKHPSRALKLYCRMCLQAGCGQCVSEEHQSIFHSVNLLDAVYQEEKVNFISNLKKMKIINEKLTTELSSQPDNSDMELNNEAEIIELEFGEIFQTLETKKQQLLEEVEYQRSKREREMQIWKKMKETQKKSTENFLKDCEKLVHDCDPLPFLKVACGLNARMRTHLDLMNIAPSYEKPQEYTQKKMDIKPVINEILALKLMPINADPPCAGDATSTKHSPCKDPLKQWRRQQNAPSTFLPVKGQEVLADGSRICIRFMSISRMAAFCSMSSEELRFQYYMEHQKQTDEIKTPPLPADEKSKFLTAEALKDGCSGATLVSSLAKASNTEMVKMGSLQRARGSQRSCSGTSNCTTPSPNTNLSETKGDSTFFHEKSSQEVTTPALSENSKVVLKEKLPVQASAVTISNEMDTNSGTLSGLKPAASVAVSVPKSEVLDAAASSLSFTGACNDSLPTCPYSSKKKDRKYLFLGKTGGEYNPVDPTDNQDYNNFRKQGPMAKTTVSDASASPNLDSEESEKSDVLFPTGRPGFCAGFGITNSYEVLPLYSLLSIPEKSSNKKTLSGVRSKSASAKKAPEHGTENLPVLEQQ